MKDKFDSFFRKKIDGIGLAIFRIFYSLILLFEVLQLLFFKNLIFDEVPFVKLAEIDFSVPIIIWIISILFLIFGLFTRFFSVINYLMSLVVIGTMDTFEYHAFYAYMGMNFLLIIMPIGRCLSLDRLLLKLKFSHTTSRYNPQKKVSQIYYLLPVFVGVGLVYFDSIFYKLSSDMWLKGLGSWMPSSLPMITHLNDQWLLNQEVLMKVLGWVTIVFEASFLFLFFRKKCRLPLFIIGFLLHFGIVIEFPIPWFGLIVMTIYILLVPVGFWNKIFKKRSFGYSLTFYYDKNCPLCIRTVLAIQHFDWFNKIKFLTVQLDGVYDERLSKYSGDQLLIDIHSIDSKNRVFSGIDTYIRVLDRIPVFFFFGMILRLPGVYHLGKRCYNFIASNRSTVMCNEDNCGYKVPEVFDESKYKIFQNLTLLELKGKLLYGLVIFFVIVQLSCIYTSWLSNDVKKIIGVEKSRVDLVLTDAALSIRGTTRTLFGLTSHPVFSQEIHFANYNHIIAVVFEGEDGKEEWLPIVNEKGMPEYYIYGPNWVNWTFRVNGQYVNQKRLIDGLKRYTSFWAGKNSISLKAKRKFKIKCKRIKTIVNWEKDFLTNQINKPWFDIGQVLWENNEFNCTVLDVEKF